MRPLSPFPFLAFCLWLGLAPRLGAESELQKADRLLRASQVQLADQILTRILDVDPQNEKALALMGEVRLAERRPVEAVTFADRALQINPSKADYHVLRGQGLGQQAQQRMSLFALPLASASLRSFETAVHLEPGNRKAVAELFNFYFHVPSIGGGSQKKALALAEQTIPLDPSRGHHMKGLILERRKDPGAAQREFRLALAADPQYAAPCLHLGYLELEMNQVDYALAHFQKLVELDPGNANSFESLGDGWMAKGRLEEAIQAYRTSLTLDPVFLPSLDHLGRALEQAGRLEEAIQHYRWCAQAPLPPKAVAQAQARLKALGVRE